MKVQYYHSIDAKLASNIGEDSVSNPVQAILELVKNSYDADATQCTVMFDGSTDGKDSYTINSITISDDGIGMTQEDLTGKFFRIGTDSKMRETLSPLKGRRVVGEKGQGHYAAKRLGRRCIITSNPLNFPKREFSESVDKTLTATLDWDDFVIGSNFGDIPSQGEILDRKEPGKHGLRLTIDNLEKTEWTKAEFQQIKNDLGLLISPSSSEKFGTSDFEIYVQYPGLERGSARVDTTALDLALYKMRAVVRGNKVTVNIYENRKDPTTNKNSFVRVPIQGKYRNEFVINPSNTSALACGDLTFELYHFPQRKPSGKGEVFDEWETKLSRKQFKLLKSAAITKFTEEHSGIKIFKDKIRIMPFGDRNHQHLYDWAGIDRAWLSKTSGNFRNRTLVGFVHLTRDSNPDIQEVATREGIKENSAFKSLIEEVIIPSKEELQDHEAREMGKKPKTQTNPVAKAEVEIDRTKEIINKMDMDEDDKTSIISSFDRTKKQIQELDRTTKGTEGRLQSTIETYRALATLGLSTLTFDHEISPKLTALRSHIDSLDELNLGVDAEIYINEALDNLDGIQSWRDFTAVFGESLSSRAKMRSAKQAIDIRQEITKIIANMDSLMTIRTRSGQERKIQVAKTVLSNVPTLYANQATLVSVFVNHLINSIKSLREVGREDPEIRIMVQKEKSDIIIDIEDNGTGIADENRDKIFDPFKSFYPKTSSNKGMGLGMTISREVIEDQYGGTVELFKTIYEHDDPGKGSTVIRITIPEKELKENKD